MTRPRLTVIGSSNTDFVMQLPKLPGVGETVTDGRFVQTFGGKGANQAVAAARAGGDVVFVTCLGNDTFAPMMENTFAAEGIDTTFVRRDEAQASGSALVMFDEAGRNYLAVAPGSNYALTAAHVRDAAGVIRGSAAVVLQNEISPEANAAAIAAATEGRVPVLLNYAPIRDAPIALSDQIAVLTVNESEASALADARPVDSDTAADIASALQASGPETVIITLGEMGVVIRQQDRCERLNAHNVEAVDTTAAGDTFCGVLAVALGEGRSMSDACRLANAAAALTVSRLGAQPSIPPRSEINTFLNRKAGSTS